MIYTCKPQLGVTKLRSCPELAKPRFVGSVAGCAAANNIEAARMIAVMPIRFIRPSPNYSSRKIVFTGGSRKSRYAPAMASSATTIQGAVRQAVSSTKPPSAGGKIRGVCNLTVSPARGGRVALRPAASTNVNLRRPSASMPRQVAIVDEPFRHARRIKAAARIAGRAWRAGSAAAALLPS
jgi:hypothetical protein